VAAASLAVPHRHTTTADALKAKRLRAGLSQQALAERSGASNAFIRLVESGYEPRRSALLPRIFRVLNEVDAASPSGADREAADAPAISNP